MIATDKGFAAHREEPHHSILIIRLKQLSRQNINYRVLRAFKRYTPEQWPVLMVILRNTVQSAWKSHHK